MNQGLAHNPFSTRHVQPGVIPYIFPEGESLEELLELLKSNQWRGEFVGPHGAGKSTLLYTVQNQLEAIGYTTGEFFCNDESPRLPAKWRRQAAGADIVFINGAEVISWWGRRQLQTYCRSRGKGLIATTHRVMGFGCVYHVSVREDTFLLVVEKLLGALSESHREIALGRLKERNGNARLALFDLYDAYEAGGF